jgi:hypothetical protein
MANWTTKTHWSYAEDRRLIELAALSQSLEEIAGELKRNPKRVAEMAKRLGASLKSDSGRKAKK